MIDAKILIQSLQQGKTAVISQRDFLVVQSYCANKGITLEVVSKKGLELTIKKS